MVGFLLLRPYKITVYQSWIFKLFCDATATHKKLSLNSVSIGGLENTWKTPTAPARLQQSISNASDLLGYH